MPPLPLVLIIPAKSSVDASTGIKCDCKLTRIPNSDGFGVDRLRGPSVSTPRPKTRQRTCAGLALGPDHGGALRGPAQCLPRFRAPHTNGTVNWRLSMWFSASAGVSTGEEQKIKPFHTNHKRNVCWGKWVSIFWVSGTTLSVHIPIFCPRDDTGYPTLAHRYADDDVWCQWALRLDVLCVLR